MNNLFAWFTTPGHLQFPGAAFVMGAVLFFISAVLANRSMNKVVQMN